MARFATKDSSTPSTRSCNFREPLASEANAAFGDDIRGWSKICDRLYVWDYTTDFRHYPQPHPNWFVLGSNIRFFANHNVKGLFEQGAYQSHGSEFSELRAWVLAQLMWDPRKNAEELIHEFLEGYYGAAAPAIRDYMTLMHEASAGWKLGCFSPTKTPFFNFNTMSRAESLWRKALEAVDGNPELMPRVRLGRVWLGYVWLSLWDELKAEAKAEQAEWPLPTTREAFAVDWLRLAGGDPDLPWTQVDLVREWGGLTPAKWLRSEGILPVQPAKSLSE